MKIDCDLCAGEKNPAEFFFSHEIRGLRAFCDMCTKQANLYDWTEISESEYVVALVMES